MINIFKYSKGVLTHNSRRSAHKLYNLPQAFFAATKNYYETLGLDKNAEPQQIKAAFYKLAKKYHPDISKGTEDKFKQINEAYEVLSDENRKRQYDNELKYGGAGGFGGFGGDPFSQGYNQGSGSYYNQGRGQNANQQRSQQTNYYTYTDSDGKRRTYSKTTYTNDPYEDFNSFFSQFQREFKGKYNNDEFRKKVYEDLKKQHAV